MSSEATLQRSIKNEENKKWWNRSWSSVDVRKQQLQRRRHFDYSCPHEGVETMRNLIEHSAVCSVSPDRIHRRTEEKFREMAATVADLPPINRVEHLRIKEGSRIANHMLSDKCRIMHVDAPMLQGRWTDDWAKPENIRTMQRLRNRVQAHADRRNHNFMLREKNRVEQIQRHRISEDGIVDRGETDAGLAPQLNIPRNEIFNAMSRIQGNPGLSRIGCKPQTGPQILSTARSGFTAQLNAYNQAMGKNSRR